MTALNWQKNFGHISTRKSAAPSRMPKFWTTVAPVVFEIFSKKFFWVVFGPIWVTQLKEFKKSPKKRRFEIFQVALESRWKLSSSWFLISPASTQEQVLSGLYYKYSTLSVSGSKILALVKNYLIFTWTPELTENFKTPFFWRFLKFLQLGNSNRSKKDPKIFFWKYLKNDGRYGRSKFWHSRWRCWFVGWDMTKIFLSI